MIRQDLMFIDAQVLPVFLFVFPVVDLSPHMYDIAEELGWTDMKQVALHSGIREAVIDSCHMNHPNNCREQTFELLSIWAEKQGRGASKNLVQILQKIGKKAKAERVQEILSKK